MKDKLSALLDGALDENSAHVVLENVRRDRGLRAEWDSYCLIGDVIRGERAIAPGFVSRVMAELDAEPTRIAPASAAASAAGRGMWRSVMPLAASVMGVAAVGLVANALYSSESPQAMVAGAASNTATETVLTAAPLRPAAVVVDPDPHREYVFAHQAMTAGGPLPDAVQYVRTVSGARQDDGR